MCRFIKSANFVSQYYQDDRNQICFVGRSNVGKSSLINSLANKKIAKTSSTPGKTQLINFFDFKSTVLVDLPGYGYAKTNKKNAELIQTLIFEYINYAKKIAGIFQLCNIDVITNQDFEICKELKKICSENNIDYFLILTKLDKITLSQENFYVNKIANFLKVDKNSIIAISNKNKMNIKKIKLIIDKIICK